MIKTIISTTLTLGVLFLFAFKALEWPADRTINNASTPPGTIQIADNLYFDKTEITNISYLEFMHWTKKTYGANSSEYRSILPDTNVWSELNMGYAYLDTLYLRHAAYHDYPVVGISYDQATAFTNWRSDKVMEYILIINEIIPYIENPSKDSVFTIERYFNGEYYGIQPHQDFLVYPQYYLPDSTLYDQASTFADSFNAQNYMSCNKKKCVNNLIIDSNCLDNKTNKTAALPFGPEPTMETRCAYCKKELIAHLKGNVREMTSTKGVYYGTSFMDSCHIPNNILRTDTLQVNSYTGFRNACEYRVWKKE